MGMGESMIVSECHKLRIGITCYPTYGGSGVLATELGKKLATQGHEIYFVSYALPYRLKGFFHNVFFPRGPGLQLPAVRVPAVHFEPGRENVRGDPGIQP